MAVDDGRTVLVGECKWKNAATGADQLEKLDERAHLAQAGDDVPRWVFSKSKFSPSCIELAASMHDARLITFDEMVV